MTQPSQPDTDSSTAAERDAIGREIREVHRQVKIGQCKCGRECRDGSGRYSRQMWKAHVIHEEVAAIEGAKS